MGKFAATLKKSGKTTNHKSALRAKAELRRLLVESLGGPERVAVFDAFAGPGGMHSEVWNECAVYVGCDERWYRDDRRVFVGDNRRVMRAVNLHAFNAFDLDAFGSPWEQLCILADRRGVGPGERVAVAITDGSGMGMKLGNVPNALVELTGLTGSRMPRANRSQERLIDTGLKAWADRMGGKIVERWQTPLRGNCLMRYLAVVVAG